MQPDIFEINWSRCSGRERTLLKTLIIGVYYDAVQNLTVSG